MPQQINLSTPVLLTQKRYFSARTMAQALLFFVVLGGALTAWGVWSLNSASASIKATLEKQSTELAALRAAVAAEKGAVGPSEKDLLAELQAARSKLAERTAVLAESRRGLFRPGEGHSAMLRLVAQTIPAQVWVQDVLADNGQLEVRGFTQDPALLNDWVARLSQSPLLSGQQLARVRVERVAPGAPTAPGAVPSSRPVWTFVLASALGAPGQGGKL
jgi:Tfp pilus assembly protein PilN